VVTFIIRRLISGVLLLGAATASVFFFMHASGTNVARAVLGTNASLEQVEAKAAELGLDRPLIVQYVDWLTGVLTGDMGDSYTKSQSVSDLVLSRASVTLSLVIVTVLVTTVIAVVVGMVSARNRGWIDQVLQGGAVLGTALPGFWIALVLVTIFAVNLKWFPATGYVAFAKDPAGWAMSLALPVAALAVAGVSGVAMQVRSAVIELGQREFVRTLVSHGLPPRRILFRHILRNAASPALVIVSLQFVGMLSGAVVVEQIFSMPGLGRLAVSSTTTSDIPVVMGIVTFMVTTVIIVNLVVDLLAAWLNPKVRLR